MKTTIFLLLLGFSLSSQANTLFQQLCTFNPNWSNYQKHVPLENERVFLSDKQYIQAHLELVLQVLKSSDLKHLDADQRIMRKHLTEVLSDYRWLFRSITTVQNGSPYLLMSTIHIVPLVI